MQQTVPFHSHKKATFYVLAAENTEHCCRGYQNNISCMLTIRKPYPRSLQWVTTIYMFSLGTHLLVNDEEATESHALGRQHVVLLHDLTLQVGDQRVCQVAHPALVAVCSAANSRSTSIYLCTALMPGGNPQLRLARQVQQQLRRKVTRCHLHASGTYCMDKGYSLKVWLSTHLSEPTQDGRMVSPQTLQGPVQQLKG